MSLCQIGIHLTSILFNPLTITFHSRNMGMGPRWLTKNKYVEEWNGRREITEKAFNATGGNVANIIFYAAVLPLGVYWLGRSELEKQGDRRYKDMC